MIVAISCDLPYAQERFCEIEGIRNITMLSDYRDIDFGLKYGFLIDELRLLTQGIVIISKERKIKYVEYVPGGHTGTLLRQTIGSPRIFRVIRFAYKQ